MGAETFPGVPWESEIKGIEETMTEMTTREELALNIDEAQWQWLKPHLERGGLITVAAALDLAEAGERIAADDSERLAAWITAGKVGRPTEEEIAASGT